MQNVSENWKNAHKRTLLNESFVEVTLDITDPDALANASSQDNGAIYISNSSLLTDGIDVNPAPYCTLEQNLWCLDGNRKAIPESNYGDNCYVSDVMSDNNCIFSTRLPVITIGFNGTFNKLIPGITITWSDTYGEFADTFTVIAYNGDEIVAEKEVTGNRSVKTFIFVDIVGYNRIEVIIKKWCLPNHRARVEEIFLGANKVYGRGELCDYSHKQSVNPVSTALPKSEIKFSIDNANGEYNPQNPSGLAGYLMEMQMVKTRYGLKQDDGSIEWIKGGTFYLSEWYAKQNGITADFTARDILEFMSAIYHDVDYYKKVRATNSDYVSNDGIITYERSLYDLAERVLGEVKLPANSDGAAPWVIHESLNNIKTTAPLPEDTLANCLQLIANAAKCVLYQDRDGILHIEPFDNVVYPPTDDTEGYKITSFNSYSKPEITLAKPISSIAIKNYTYTFDGKDVKSDSQTITWSGIEGMPTVGEKIIVDNPLVTDGGQGNISEWMLGSYLWWRKTLDLSWRADVRLDALDYITNENVYNTCRVLMTDVEYRYNGAFRATGKGKVIGDG